jgi:hypothetical protein
VIRNADERDSALRELKYLWNFLREVEDSDPEDSLTKVGIHKMMARIHEELMDYEARRELEMARASAKTTSEERVEAPAETAVSSN